MASSAARLVVGLFIVALLLLSMSSMQPKQRFHGFHPAFKDSLTTLSESTEALSNHAYTISESAAAAASDVLTSAADTISAAADRSGDVISYAAGAASAVVSQLPDQIPDSWDDVSALVGMGGSKRDETQDALAGFKAFVDTNSLATPANTAASKATNGAATAAAAAAAATSAANTATASATPPLAIASSPPPPDVQACADNSRELSQSDILCRVPRGGLAFVSLANGAYSELGINWALLLLPILAKVGHEGRAFLYALDDAAVRAFLKARLPTVRQSTAAKHNPLSMSTDGFRWEPGAFRDYGVTKADVIVWLLKAGRDVCFSDVDAAWVKLPYQLLQSVPDADVLSGTDCLHVPFDADRSPRPHSVKNCGHQPGSKWSAWFNTGVMLFRGNQNGNQNAIDVVLEWRDRMAAVKGDAQIDDQLTFNQLVGTVWSNARDTKGVAYPNTFRNFYPIRAAGDNGRTIYDGNGTRRIHAMPASQICSAHVYHVQQSATSQGCLVLHLTFVEGWPKNPAKYWRLREAGLLAVQPEKLSNKYLAFTPPQPQTIPPDRHPSLPQGRPNGELPNKTSDNKGWPVSTALVWSPRLAAHLDLTDRNIAALRNAMAIAKALGRELIMPRMMCLCERAEGPAALLPSCVLDGASTPIPHVCPLESVFDVARVERLWQTGYLKLHPWTLLNSSIHVPSKGESPFEPSKDIVTVRWSASADSAPVYDGNKREVWLPKGGSDVQVQQGVAQTGIADARVLHLESAEMVFGGFEKEAIGREFHNNIMNHLLGGWSATWCCTSWDKPRGTISFKRPLPLPTGAMARAGSARQLEIPAKRPCYWRDCDASGHQK